MNKQEWLPKEVFHNRRLVFSLARNDFRTKYAGSWLGTVWAFIQPIVTIIVYWFVFGLVLKGGRMGVERNVPFVLWLVAGLVPWFFLQDGLIYGTSALMEYSYLVKKVVFNIRILPLVKVISAIFVHIFFVVITIVLYALLGFLPTPYYLQLIYYSFCVFMLIVGIVYLTSAIVVFFRDLTQIITIILQVGIWLTPIMWSFTDLGIGRGFLGMLLRLNPMFYIVQGYRDSLIDQVGFWQHPRMTIYFWLFTVIFLLIGTQLFKRLQVHFADVL